MHIKLIMEIKLCLNDVMARRWQKYIDRKLLIGETISAAAAAAVEEEQWQVCEVKYKRLNNSLNCFLLCPIEDASC